MRSESAVRQEELGDLARQIASQLKGDGQSGASARAANVIRPAFSRAPAPRPEQVAALNAIVKAADLISARQEQIALSDRRAQEAEELVAATKRELTETEDKLRNALDLANRERRRAEEAERRGAEMMDRTQALMAEASSRLEATEKRAELAEDYLSTLQKVIRERFED